MGVCSKCGAEINPQQRFCGSCGQETQATAQQTEIRPTVSQQAVYVPPAAQAAPAAIGKRSDSVARVAMGLGIGGGLLGILWGALGPYLTMKFPSHFAWGVYGTGLKAEILLIIGLALGVLAVIGAAVTTKAVGAARVLLVVSGLGGFALGGQWLIPGALLLAAAGLAIAAKPQQ